MGGGVERDQISHIRPLKNQISDPSKNQISDISRSQKSDIWLKKSDISDPKKIQLSDFTPPKKSNIRYQGTPVPPPPHLYHNMKTLTFLAIWGSGGGGGAGPQQSDWAHIDSHLPSPLY